MWGIITDASHFLLCKGYDVRKIHKPLSPLIFYSSQMIISLE